MSKAPAGIVDPQDGHVPRLDAVFDMGIREWELGACDKDPSSVVKLALHL